MSQSLYFYLCAVIAGIVSGSYFNLPFFCIAISALGALFLRKGSSRRMAITALLFSLGSWRASFMIDQAKPFADYLGTTQEWSFYVCRDPEPLWNGQTAVLCPLSPTFKEQKGRVIARLDLYPRVEYGDSLVVRCRLELPPIYEDFDYASYLSAQGIGATCSFPKVIRMEEGKEGIGILRLLFGYKRAVLRIINEALPEPAAGLGTALLLGYKKTLMPASDLDFKRAGLSHIVAISGGHISLFLELMITGLAFFRIGKRYSMWPAIILAFVYVLMTGLQASAWRSFIMGALTLIFWRKGKPQSIWLLLLIAAAIMLLQKPTIWRYDLGFQLSFLAIGGMAAFEPSAASKIYPYETGLRRFAATLRSAFNLSLSAQLAVWPLLALNGSGISLVSPFSNVMAFWVFGLLVVWMLAALGMSIIAGVSYVFWIPSHALLAYLLEVGKACSRLPLAFIPSDWFRPWMALLYYILLIFWLIKRNRRYNIDKL